MVVNCESIQHMVKLITVLIADDNTFMLESLEILLSDLADINLIAKAKNGEEAISFAVELSPDIILMDVNMSPVNGFEATRKILKQNPAIKIIGLSMHKEESYCNNLLRLGAKGFVTKSSHHSEIIAAIREVAAGRKYISRS